MVYAVIDRKSCKAYTYLADVFDAIGEEVAAHNWLITDADIAAVGGPLDALNTDKYRTIVNGIVIPSSMPKYHFLSGEELAEIVRREDAQWLWGVLSGFDKSIPLKEIIKSPLPWADGYAGFWQNPPTIQHPLADIEIVAWDGEWMLLFSRKKETIDRFRAKFPACEELSAYNAE
ncbi:MAG: hypothetical protein IJS53_00765 [Clostridia bacterium]|nr:hypothetical protein [Clostridia bacterium]